MFSMSREGGRISRQNCVICIICIRWPITSQIIHTWYTTGQSHTLPGSLVGLGNMPSGSTLQCLHWRSLACNSPTAAPRGTRETSLKSSRRGEADAVVWRPGPRRKTCEKRPKKADATAVCYTATDHQLSNLHSIALNAIQVPIETSCVHYRVTQKQCK